jgi:hypothetical protein
LLNVRTVRREEPHEALQLGDGGGLRALAGVQGGAASFTSVDFSPSVVLVAQPPSASATPTAAATGVKRCNKDCEKAWVTRINVLNLVERMCRKTLYHKALRTGRGKSL